MRGLTLDRLTVAYGRHRVIADVSCAVRAGELCALLGRNGSGKSTLLKAVCGLLPYGGRVAVDGVSLGKQDERARARQIAYLPQRSSSGTGLTVADMVLMGYNPQLGLLDRPNRAQRARAGETIGRVGLAGYEDRLFDALSEGERQLAQFARALVQDAPVMLLDEPDSALDFVNRHQLLEKMADTVRSAEKAGLVTLHDPNFALAYCDRLLLLKDGGLAGDIAVKTAGTAALETALGALYGNIKIISYEGGRMMVRSGA